MDGHITKSKGRRYATPAESLWRDITVAYHPYLARDVDDVVRDAAQSREGHQTLNVQRLEGVLGLESIGATMVG